MIGKEGKIKTTLHQIACVRVSFKKKKKSSILIVVAFAQLRYGLNDIIFEDNYLLNKCTVLHIVLNLAGARQRESEI